MSEQRIGFLDLARGLAVLFMIMQHSMIMYAVNEGEGSFIGDLVVLSGTVPAAPVFMMIMGVFFLKSKSMKASTIRGLKLIVLGYILNFFRFFLPVLIGGEYPVTGPDSLLGQLLEVDILQMAGLSLIIMVLIRDLEAGVWASTALYVALMSPLLWQLAPQNPLLDLFWGTRQNVAFPLFPWLIYPLTGMIWGKFLNRAENLDRFTICTGLTGIGFLLSGCGLWAWADISWMPLGEYSRCGFQGHLMIIGFVFMWLPLIRVLEKFFSGTRICALLIFWSRHVTVIYIIQWLLIGWGMLIFDYQQLDPGWAALIGILIVFLTHGIVKIYLKLDNTSLTARLHL
jgi:surface polysaccharide O-acyltransferase-like enzyme